MRTFKDSDNREWTLTVNVGTAKAVKALAGVNLFALHTTEAERVFGDPCLLVNVLYVLVRDQCAARHMTDEDFGRGMVGDSIESAANALLSEVAFFFPSARRELLLKQMSKAQEMTDQIMARASERLDTLDLKTLLGSSTRSPESSGSTPLPTPSES